MKEYSQKTIEIAIENDWQNKIIEEIRRLLLSGAVDQDSHNRALVFGVALENVADGYLRGEKKTKDYRNLKHF